GPRRSRIWLHCVAGTTAPCTKRVTRWSERPMGSSASACPTVGFYLRPRLLPSCLPIPSRPCERITRRMDFVSTLERGIRAGRENGWTSHGPSTSCIPWLERRPSGVSTAKERKRSWLSLMTYERRRTRGSPGPTKAASAAIERRLELGEDLDRLQDRWIDAVGHLEGHVAHAQPLIFGQLPGDLLDGAAHGVAAAKELLIHRPLMDALDEHGNAHRPLRVALAARVSPELRDRLLALPEGLRGGGGGVPAVAQSGHAAEGALAAAADPDGRARLLQRHRRHLEIGEVVALRLQLGALLGPERAEELEGFLAPAHALLEGHAEGGKLALHPADGGAHDEATAREHVD